MGDQLPVSNGRTMRLTPVVALVSDETLVALTPLLDELTAQFDPPGLTLPSGWTPEGVAWGVIIAAASRCDLEIAGRYPSVTSTTDGVADT